jgi:hypothetical protein
MTITSYVPRRLAAALLATASFVLVGPVAQAATGAEPGTEQVSSPVATGWSLGGELPITIDSPIATGWSSAGGLRNASSVPAQPLYVARAVPPAGDGFDWGDAGVGFGAAAFAALVLAGGAFLVRRWGTLIHSP